MPEKLGILVTSDKHLDHLVGIAEAARDSGREVEVFLTHKGVLLTRHPGFAQLDGLAHVSLCKVNLEFWGLTDPVPLVAENDFTNQARNARLIEECTRYIVL